jgi:cholesterol transport system auxiliary component
MTTSRLKPVKSCFQYVVVVLLCLGLQACSLVKPGATEPPAFYALTAPGNTGAPGAMGGTPGNLPTLIITPPRAAAGFDTQRMMYVRSAHRLEYFAHSEWVDTPARMLGPLMASHLAATGAFAAVVVTPAGAAGDLRLETEIIRLQQNFATSPSRVQFALRAHVLDDKTRRVLVWHEFQAEAPVDDESPQGGAAAANRAVQQVLTDLAQFVAALPR